MICDVHNYGLDLKLVSHPIASHLNYKENYFWDDNEHDSTKKHTHNFET